MGEIIPLEKICSTRVLRKLEEYKMNRTRLLVLMASTVLATSVYAAGPGKGGGPGTGMMGPGSGMETGHGMMQPGAQAQMMQQMRLQNLDVNGDGKITRDELQTQEQLANRMRQQWQEADQNHDGNVDRSEFSAFRERVREELQHEQQTQPGTEESGD
jgi:hypothetical protein